MHRAFTKDAHQGCQTASQRAHLGLMSMELRNSEYSDRFVRRNDDTVASSCLRLRRVFTKDAHQGCQRASQKAHLGLTAMELRNSEYSNRFGRRNDVSEASSCLRLRRAFTKDAHQGLPHFRRLAEGGVCSCRLSFEGEVSGRRVTTVHMMSDSLWPQFKPLVLGTGQLLR